MPDDVGVMRQLSPSGQIANVTLPPDSPSAAPSQELVRELTELFTEQRERLLRIAAVRLDTRLANRVDVDDVLQETWLAAMRRLQHYRADRAPLFVWVRMVLVQTLTDLARRQLGAKRRGGANELSLHDDANGDDVGLLGRLLSTVTSPTRAVARAEQAERLTRRLAALAPIDREILLLRHFEGLGNGEAAAVLGVHKAAATNRHLRALARLHEALRAEGIESIDG